jgi:5'-deoxynucleotidase YfbR-like HD superfamily hydrolase
MRQTLVNEKNELLGVRHVTSASPVAPVEVIPGVKPARVGSYMHTAPYGRKFWPLDPRPHEVNIQTVAHHLATCARYNGATQHPEFRSKIFYSVAEHSVYVSLYLEKELKRPDLALEGLLHDGSEAFNGDLIRPLKYDAVFRAPFQKVEELNERAQAVRFGLIYPYPKEVKMADEAVTTAEIEQIVPKDLSEEWESGKLRDDKVAAPYRIIMLEPYEAKMMFLDRYEDLMRWREAAQKIPNVA